MFSEGRLQNDRLRFVSSLVDGEAPVFNEIKLIKSLKLVQTYSMSLFKLQGFDKPQEPFIVGSCPVAAPFDKFFRSPTNDWQWWDGSLAEIEVAKAQAAKEKTAAERASAAAAKAGPKPKADPARFSRPGQYAPRNHRFPVPLTWLPHDGLPAEESGDADALPGGESFEQDWSRAAAVNGSPSGGPVAGPSAASPGLHLQISDFLNLQGSSRNDLWIRETPDRVSMISFTARAKSVSISLLRSCTSWG